MNEYTLDTFALTTAQIAMIETDDRATLLKTLIVHGFIYTVKLRRILDFRTHIHTGDR